VDAEDETLVDGMVDLVSLASVSRSSKGTSISTRLMMVSAVLVEDREQK
jgi:hypothetical protein